MPPNPNPLLCYVTDRRALALPGESARRDAVLRIARAVAAAGVDWIQIREKDLPTRTLLQMTGQAVVVAQGTARIVVNDRLDVALAAGAAGVHLGGESLPVAELHAWRTRGPAIPAGFLLGVSTHSMAEARQAEQDGADYLFFGPVFSTPSKLQYGEPQGVEKLRGVCSAVRIPVLAIGGITVENAAECLRAGAAGLAAIRLFQEATDVAAVVRALRAAA